MELPEGTILAHVLDAKENIPMQFGREVCRNNALNKCLLCPLFNDFENVLWVLWAH